MELRRQREAVEQASRRIKDWFDALLDDSTDVFELDFQGKRKQLEALGVAVTVNYRNSDRPRFTVSIEQPIPAGEF